MVNDMEREHEKFLKRNQKLRSMEAASIKKRKRGENGKHLRTPTHSFGPPALDDPKTREVALQLCQSKRSSYSFSLLASLRAPLEELAEGLGFDNTSRLVNVLLIDWVARKISEKDSSPT